MEAQGHEPIHCTKHVEPLRAPEAEAGASALPVTPQIDHQHREASPAECDRKVGEFSRDIVTEVPVELARAVGILAMDQHNCHATTAGRDVPAGDLDAVAVRREADFL